MKPPKLSGKTLTVIFRNDSPMWQCGDSPSYRRITIPITEEQQQVLKLRWVGKIGNDDLYEDISKCFIDEPEDETP